MAGPASAGTRDHYVTIQGITERPALSGVPVKTLTGVSLSLYAAKRDLSARERFAGDQVSARADQQWDLPYLPAIDPEQVDVASAFQLVYLGRTYDIIGAELIGRRNGVRVMTMARVG